MRRGLRTFSPQLNLVSNQPATPDSGEDIADNFDGLLDWLTPDREEAGRKYEEIRQRLIRIFTCRCCDCPEDLADETMNRVIKKVHLVAPGYRGDPALYFCGVARNVAREYQKRRVPTPPPPVLDRSIEERAALECLDYCIDELTPKNRKLIIEFYSEDKGERILKRKKMAEELGIAPNALRIRAHRIRRTLETCVLNCLEEKRRLSREDTIHDE
jgi:DNA-directed RNA polymerase specialized sigma24 family protein